MVFQKAPQPILHYALNLLGRRRYTEKEMRQKFRKRKISADEENKIIGRLKEMKLLNDTEYAGIYIDAEQRRAPQGSIMIKNRLQKKGFSPDDIETALQNRKIDESELARIALSKKTKNFTATHEMPISTATREVRISTASGASSTCGASSASIPSSGKTSRADYRKHTQKLYRFLLSRGFSPSVSIKTIEEYAGQSTLL